LALGSGAVLVGVTAAEVLFPAVPVGEEAIWVGVARRGRVFAALRDGEAEAFAAGDFAVGWEVPRGAWMVGDGQDGVMERAGVLGLRATGHRFPTAEGIARVALARLAAGDLAEVRPVYVDPPEAKPPAAGLRPAPC